MISDATVIAEGERPVVLIYRIEHQDGRGPTQSGLDRIHYNWAEWAILTGRESSPPVVGHIKDLAAKDGLQHAITSHHIFGSDSLEVLRMWFPSRIGCMAMAEAGGRVVTYSVPAEHVIAGWVRSAFDVRHSVRIASGPSSELHAP